MTSRITYARVIAVFNALSFVIAVVLNYFANARNIWNGTRVGDVANDHPTRFSPASYAFSIWSLIFIGLGIGIVYQLALVAWPRKAKVACVEKMSFLFILNYGLNGFWGAAFAYEQFWLSWAMIFILLGTLVALYWRLGMGDRAGFLSLKTQPELQRLEKYARKWQSRSHIVRQLVLYAPISLYFGWLCVATIANGAVVLKHAGWHQAESFWSIFMQSIATLIAVVVLLRHWDVFFAAAVAWGLFAVGIQQKKYAVVRAFAFSETALLVLLSVVIAGFRAANFFKARREYRIV